MPILKREGNSAKLDLTIPFLVWTVVFGGLALLFSSTTLLLVALFPWMLWAGFIVAVFVFGMLAFGIAYWAGKPIEWKNEWRGTSKTIQRKKYRA